MINMNTLDLADLAGLVQPLIDDIPGPLYSVDLNSGGSITVHTQARVDEFPEDLVWRANISPTWVTELNVSGIPVTVFAKGEPYTKEGAA